MRIFNRQSNRIESLLKSACPVVLAMSLPLTAWAGNGSGTTGAQFLEIGVGARELAMGSAGVALVDDAHAMYWNPAGAATIATPRLDASYNNLYQDTNQGFVGFALPARGGVWSAGADYLQVPSIERRLGDYYTPDYTFTSKDSALMLSYARPNTFLPGLALGANVKLVQSYLDSASAHAFAVDFGALYRAVEKPWSLGFSLANLGTGLKYVDATEPLPLGVRFGGSYGLFEHRLVLAASVDSWLRDARTYEDVGVEYKPVSWTALRVGYQAGHAQDQLGSSLVGFSTGVGFQFWGLNVDYVFIPYGDLGTTQRFTVGYRFGDAAAPDLQMKSH